MPSFATAAVNQYDQATGLTMFNLLRKTATGQEYESPPPTGDPVVDSLGNVAIDIYGEFLIEPIALPGFGPPMSSTFGSPAGRGLVQAICDDSSLPWGSPDAGTGIPFSRSTGSWSHIQVSLLASSLLTAAWDTARLGEEYPKFDQLLSAIPSVVETARAAISSGKANITGLASFTGAVLAKDVDIDFGWGRIRPAWQSDNPIRSQLDQQTTFKVGDETLEMSDAGDIVLEANVPWRVSYGEEATRSSTDSLDTTTGEAMEQRILQVRLAFLLASDGDDAPALLPVWRRYIEPLKQGDSIGWSPPDRFRSRTPARVDVQFGTSWRTWSQRLDDNTLHRLGVAPQRLIRAAAERAAPDDRLIDAVIAWEALFGSTSEATLRVAGSMGRLLHTESSRRLETERQANRIYRLRSRLVHGAEDVVPTEVEECGRAAVRLGTEALRMLLTKRPELLAMESPERSRHLLVG